MDKSKKEPHFLGHRARVKEKFLKSPSSLQDYELLELSLFWALPRKDTKPIAKQMLADLKNLASIIQARMEEIIEHVYYEIKHSGYEKKLIAGIVVTGGGAQLKHVSQLVEYITGMDTRIGYPNEHLAKGSEEVTSPLFATSVGLVMKGLQTLDKQNTKMSSTEAPSKIKGHSKERTTGFFDKLKSFFDEDAASK